MFKPGNLRLQLKSVLLALIVGFSLGLLDCRFKISDPFAEPFAYLGNLVHSKDEENDHQDNQELLHSEMFHILPPASKALRFIKEYAIVLARSIGGWRWQCVRFSADNGAYSTRVNCRTRFNETLAPIELLLYKMESCLCIR